MEHETVTLPTAHLPVWPLVRRTYAWLWQQRAALAPVLLGVLALNLLCDLLIEWKSAPSLFSASFLGSCTLLLLACDTALTVGVSRAVVLHESRRGMEILCWGRPFWAFGWIGLKWCVGMIVLLYPFFMSMAMSFASSSPFMGRVMAYGGMLGGICAAIFYFVRTQLAFTGAAVGAPGGLVWSWNATRGVVFRLIAVYILVNLPFGLLGLLLDRLALSLDSPEPVTLAQSMLASVLIVLWLPVGAALAALCFEALAGDSLPPR